MQSLFHTHDETEITFLHCPECNGFGFLLGERNVPVPCQACDKKPSVLGVFHNKVLFYGKVFSRRLLAEEKMIEKIHQARIGALSLFAALGLVMLVLQFWDIATSGASWIELLTRQNAPLLIFYLSLFADFYAWYLLSKDRKIPQLIPISIGNENGTAPDTYQQAMAHHQKTAIDVANFLDEKTKEILNTSFLRAVEAHHTTVEPVHIMLELVKTKKVRLIFGRLGISYQSFVDRMENLAQKIPKTQELALLGQNWQKAVVYAFSEAVKKHEGQITVVELFEGVVFSDKYIYDIVYDLGCDLLKLKHVIEWLHSQKMLVERLKQWKTLAAMKPKSFMNRALTARPTPVLNRVSSDWTLTARAGGFYPLVGREEEMNELIRALKESVGSALVIGPSGVGKTLFIQGLAERMAAEDVPEELRDKRLVAIDVAELLAQGRQVGGEALGNAILNEMYRAGNVILVVENIESLFRSDMSGALEVANALATSVGQGFVKIIATTTPENYRTFIESHPGFVRRFKNVVLSEPDFDLSMKIMESRASIFEYQHAVYYTYDALHRTIVLTAKYINDRYLPEKALDILEQAALFAVEARGENTLVEGEDVAEIVSKKVGVPLTSITMNEKQQLLGLEDTLHKRIIGQQQAVEAVANALRRSRERLQNEGKPMANFLFLGPTGVGKTELAKALAENYFGSENAMIRIDMSEYQTTASVFRLVGGPAMLGGNGMGILTEAVRQKPFSLILLDEFEKAHPDVLNVFLQIMDDGRVTDGQGRLIRFHEAIIIATSNAGSKRIYDGMKNHQRIDVIKQDLLENFLPKTFAPELLNRFDEIIVFESLGWEEVEKITELMLKKLGASLEGRGVVFTFSKQAVKELAEMGYDPKNGARPLRRVIQKTVEDALAKQLLLGEIQRGDTILLKTAKTLEVQKQKTFA